MTKYRDNGSAWKALRVSTSIPLPLRKVRSAPSRGVHSFIGELRYLDAVPAGAGRFSHAVVELDVVGTLFLTRILGSTVESGG